MIIISSSSWEIENFLFYFLFRKKTKQNKKAKFSPHNPLPPLPSLFCRAE